MKNIVPMNRVFLDTSVIFAAVLSPNGGARTIFRLGEAGYLQLLIGPSVLKECETVIRRKVPQTLPELALLINIAGIQVTSAAGEEAMKFAGKWIEYPADRLIMAEAIESRPDWFVTHDHKHFLNLPDGLFTFRIGTPGDFLEWLRSDFLSRRF